MSVNKLNKILFRSVLVSLFIFCALAQTACVSPDKGYLAGQLAAGIYVDTKALQSEQLRTVIETSYAVLKRVNDGEALDIESIIEEELAKISINGQQLVTMKILVLSYYENAIKQLMAETGVTLPQSPEVLQRFEDGVESVLKLYNL